MAEAPGGGRSAEAKALRWTRWALLASLAVNLAVAGLVAGSLIGKPPRGGLPDRPLPGRELALGPFFEALAPRDRRALGDAMRREGDALHANRAALRAQFEALLAALRAEPYEAGEVRRLIDAQNARVSERQALGRRLLLERIAAMSPAERAAFADRLDRLLRRPPRP